MKVFNKKGISLISMIIVVIVFVLLMSVGISSLHNSIDDTTLMKFNNDLNIINDLAESYYIDNNELPYSEEYTAMNTNEILSIARYSNLLLEEITAKNDLDSIFYVIDLKKINIKKIQYGNKKLGSNDIFVISYPTMNIYYLYGLDLYNNVYFSNIKTTKYTNIPQIVKDASSTSVITSGGITITKNNEWANKMGVTIETEMKEDEELYMSVSGGTNRLITTTLGSNKFGFDLLSSIINNLETIKVPTLTLVEANYIEQGTKPINERYVDILKYKNLEVIGRLRINLSNFSLNLPTITNVTVSSYSKMNTLKLLLANSESGIKEIRYEYLTKYSENGMIVNYYDGISDFDEVYMKTKGKKAIIASDLTTTINANKNVNSIKIAVIDKAGNVNLYNQDIAPKLYIGYSLDDSTIETIQVTANMYSNNGIKSIRFSISEAGYNFTNEQYHTIDSTINGVTSKQSDPFTNIQSDIVYIKMIATNYTETVTETRLVKLNLNQKALGLNVIAIENSTYDGKEASYNNPIIPKGFKAVNEGTTWPTSWNDGLVIEDTYGNQFVWVPVDGTNVEYSKNYTYPSWWTPTSENISDDSLPTGVDSELDQITKYGGFYIARYEAGKEGTDTLVSKQGIYVWNNINYTDSKAKSEGMYNTSSVKSGIVTGTGWDTAMRWINNEPSYDVINSTEWGNHSNNSVRGTVSPNNPSNTGAHENWKSKNIYDLAGNTWEWTNEIYSTYRVVRGGSCDSSGSDHPATYRSNGSISIGHVFFSFRPMLYIL